MQELEVRETAHWDYYHHELQGTGYEKGVVA